MSSVPKTLKIFAHDAGSANATIAAAYYFERDNGYSVEAYGRGPAVDIYRKLGARWLRPESELKFSPADLVVTGLSGVHSKFELEMVREARVHGVRETISILDKPFNFDLRFQKNGQFLGAEYYPDVIWAAGLREQVTSPELKSRIVSKENPYWVYLRDVVYPALPPPVDPFISRYQGSYLFYVTDYVSEQYGTSLGYDEFSLLRGFLDSVSRFEKKPPVVLKTHPAEAHDKYDHVLREFALLDILRVAEQSLQECVFHSKAIFGHLSSVFEESSILEKPVFSLRLGSIDRNRPASVGVQIITNQEELGRVIRGLIST